MTYLNKKIILTLTVTALFTMGFVAQVSAATVNVTAQTTITAPTLTVTSTAPLDFGNVIASTGANVLTIDATGGAAVAVRTGFGTAVQTTTGGSGVIDVVTNVGANVTFSCTSIKGSDNINPGGSPSMLTIASGTATSTGGYQMDAIPLLPATINTNSTTTPLAALAGPTGTNSINVGGVLNISNALISGSYSGTLIYTVAYQ